VGAVHGILPSVGFAGGVGITVGVPTVGGGLCPPGSGFQVKGEGVGVGTFVQFVTDSIEVPPG